MSSPELLRVMLSANEKSILREVAGRGPCKAQEVLDAVAGKVNRNAFWTLWSNLQHRGLVEEADDGRFALAVGWVAGLAGAGRTAA